MRIKIILKRIRIVIIKGTIDRIVKEIRRMRRNRRIRRRVEMKRNRRLWKREIER